MIKNQSVEFFLLAKFFNLQFILEKILQLQSGGAWLSEGI